MKPTAPTRSLAVRACVAGFAACAVGLAAAFAVGLVPVASRSQVLLGAGVAVLTGTVGLGVQAGLSLVPASHPSAAQRFVLGIAANSGLQVVALGVSALLLVRLETKFDAIAAFAIAFAAAATVFHVTGVAVLSRALIARPRGPQLQSVAVHDGIAR